MQRVFFEELGYKDFQDLFTFKFVIHYI